MRRGIKRLMPRPEGSPYTYTYTSLSLSPLLGQWVHPNSPSSLPPPPPPPPLPPLPAPSLSFPPLPSLKNTQTCDISYTSSGQHDKRNYLSKSWDGSQGSCLACNRSDDLTVVRSYGESRIILSKHRYYSLITQPLCCDTQETNLQKWMRTNSTNDTKWKSWPNL